MKAMELCHAKIYEWDANWGGWLTRWPGRPNTKYANDDEGIRI